MNSGRVQENHLAVFGCLNPNDSIACGLRLIADDGYFLSDQFIEKGGFAHVGSANEGNKT
jgi:hypothetical protein